MVFWFNLLLEVEIRDWDRNTADLHSSVIPFIVIFWKFIYNQFSYWLYSRRLSARNWNKAGMFLNKQFIKIFISWHIQTIFIPAVFLSLSQTRILISIPSTQEPIFCCCWLKKMVLSPESERAIKKLLENFDLNKK